MTRPSRRPTSRHADGPEILDRPPPPRSGVPVERDPVTGRRPLRGGPRREDKHRPARQQHPWRVPALVAAGVLVVVAAVVGVVAVVGGGDEPTTTADSDRTPSGSGSGEGGDSGDGGGGGAAAGERSVPLTFTVTAVRAAPGLEDRVTAGSSYDAIWRLTGPCDGDGACTVEHCRTEDVCLYEAAFTPTGSGYTGQFEFSAFDRPWPECGAVRIAVQVDVGDGGLSGTFTQQHGTPLGFDGDTSVCDFAVFDSSFVSA